MHTLAELNPKVGDVVVYEGLHSTMEHTVTGLKDGVWTLQEPTLGVFKVSPQFANKARWTLKQEKNVTVVHCQNPRYTLAQLNPKKGNKVCWHQPEKVVEYEVVRADGEGHWFLRLPNGEGYWFPNCSVPYDLACWTNKPQPKEKTVTVAELNLKVGDRIRSGDRTGTCIGNNLHYPYVTVVWDWDCAPHNYAKDTKADWTLLPKPEPTLASLGLKAGDPVYFPTPNRCGLVKRTDDKFAYFTDHKGEEFSYCLSSPAFWVQKLEVPK